MLHLYLPGQSLTQPQLRPPGPLPVPQMPLLMKKEDRGLWTLLLMTLWSRKVAWPKALWPERACIHTHTGLLNTIHLSNLCP